MNQPYLKAMEVNESYLKNKENVFFKYFVILGV